MSRDSRSRDPLRESAWLAIGDELEGVGVVRAAHRTAQDRQLRLGELADLPMGVGNHDQVAQLWLERWLRGRRFGEEADRVA